jgi:hypothetical protein
MVHKRTTSIRKSSGHDKKAAKDPSNFTEQGRRMSEALSDVNASKSDNGFLAETSNEFNKHNNNNLSGSVRHQTTTPAATAQSPESALLRDQSQLLVKDAFASAASAPRTGRISKTEFDLPLSSQDDFAVDDDDDTNGDYSTSDGDSRSRGGGNSNNKNVKKNDFAAKENSHVFYAKIFVFIVLSCSAGSVAYLTYWFVSQGEEQDAQQQVRQTGVLVCSTLTRHHSHHPPLPSFNSFKLTPTNCLTCPMPMATISWPFSVFLPLCCRRGRLMRQNKTLSWTIALPSGPSIRCRILKSLAVEVGR